MTSCAIVKKVCFSRTLRKKKKKRFASHASLNSLQFRLTQSTVVNFALANLTGSLKHKFSLKFGVDRFPLNEWIIWSSSCCRFQLIDFLFTIISFCFYLYLYDISALSRSIGFSLDVIRLFWSEWAFNSIKSECTVRKLLGRKYCLSYLK